METDVYRSQNKVAQFISTRPIMDLCLEVEQIPGQRVSNWWWEKDGVDVEGTQAAYWEAEQTEEEEETDREEMKTY